MMKFLNYGWKKHTAIILLFLITCSCSAKSLWAREQSLNLLGLKDITNSKNSRATLYAVGNIDEEGRGKYILEIIFDKWIEGAEFAFAVNGFSFGEHLPDYETIKSIQSIGDYNYMQIGKVTGVLGGEVWHYLEGKEKHILSPDREYAYEYYSVTLSQNTNNNMITIPIYISGEYDSSLEKGAYLEIIGDEETLSDSDLLCDYALKDRVLITEEVEVIYSERFELKNALEINQINIKRDGIKTTFQKEKESEPLKSVSFTVGSKKYIDNGQTKQMAIKAPYIKDGSVMVPAGIIAETLSLRYENILSYPAPDFIPFIYLWDSKKKLFFNYTNTNVAKDYYINEPIARISTVPDSLVIRASNGLGYAVDYLPVASVAKLFGYKVSWDNKTQTVTIIS